MVPDIIRILNKVGMRLRMHQECYKAILAVVPNIEYLQVALRPRLES